MFCACYGCLFSLFIEVLAACHVSRKAAVSDGILPTKLYCTNANVDAEPIADSVPESHSHSNVDAEQRADVAQRALQQQIPQIRGEDASGFTLRL